MYKALNVLKKLLLIAASIIICVVIILLAWPNARDHAKMKFTDFSDQCYGPSMTSQISQTGNQLTFVATCRK